MLTLEPFAARSLTLTDCAFTGNAVVNSSSSASGGAINNEVGTLTVLNSTFSGNFVSAPGGVIAGGAIANYGTLMIVNSTFSGNSAAASGGGGGIANGGSLTILDSTFSDNTAAVGGGILNNNVGSLTMTDCTISGNSAVISGAGTGYGGGIFTEGGPVTLTSCTISANSAAAIFSGGGIYAFGTGPVALRNTIVASNTAPSNPDVDGSISSQGHNLIGNGNGGGPYSATDLVGTSAHPIDPQLGPLQDNGGPTQTMALLAGSPALNSGDPAQLGIADQRGVARSGGVNIGAYQASASALVLTVPDTATAGAAFDLTVQAVDTFGQSAIGYTGTVTFSATDTASGVMLPADYNFATTDDGMHTFSGVTTLISAGSQTLTATDTANNSINGSAPVIVNP